MALADSARLRVYESRERAFGSTTYTRYMDDSCAMLACSKEVEVTLVAVTVLLSRPARPDPRVCVLCGISNQRASFGVTQWGRI